MTHIALDYDHTYTADPVMWDDFIAVATLRGHRVSIVTFRDDRFDMTPALKHLRDIVEVPVICTRGVAKKFFMDNFDVSVDIWIDDRPEGILANSGLSPEGLAAWRLEDQASRSEIERPAA